MQHEVTISIWPFIAIWFVLVINCALLFILLMKKNPTIVINNEHSVSKNTDNIGTLEYKQAMVGNEKHWPPPGVLVEPPEPGNLFPKNIPSFKDKPKPSGFGG